VVSQDIATCCSNMAESGLTGALSSTSHSGLLVEKRTLNGSLSPSLAWVLLSLLSRSFPCILFSREIEPLYH
jgi:hypothetical protein